MIRQTTHLGPGRMFIYTLCSCMCISVCICIQSYIYTYIHTKTLLGKLMRGVCSERHLCHRQFLEGPASTRGVAASAAPTGRRARGPNRARQVRYRKRNGGKMSVDMYLCICIYIYVHMYLCLHRHVPTCA